MSEPGPANTAVDLMLACAWGSTLSLLAAAAGAMLASRQTAASRHRLWAFAIGACALLPVLQLTTSRPRLLDVVLQAWAPAPAAPRAIVAATAGASGATADLAAPAPHGIGARWARGPLTRSSTWLALWSLGVLIASAGLVRGARRLRRHRRAATPAGPSWQRSLALARARIGVSRPVVVRLVEGLASPLICGIRAHEILVPSAGASWSAERRHAVLLHELGHAARADVLTSLLARIVCALYWFQPLAWVAWHRMNAEREQACDALVLRHGVRASRYAEHLLEIAAPPLPFAAGMALAARGGLAARIRTILDPRPRRATRGVTIAGAVAIAILVVTLGPGRAATPLASRDQLVHSRPAGLVFDERTGRVIGVRRTTVPIFGWCEDRFSLVVQGDVAFSGEGAIASMGDGGYLLVESLVDGKLERVEVFGRRDGRGYLLSNRLSMAADAGDRAERWLAWHLPPALAETPIAIEPRVALWLEQGGAAEAIARIERNPSSFVRAACLDVLTRWIDLDQALAPHALAIARGITETMVSKDRIIERLLP